MKKAKLLRFFLPSQFSSACESWSRKKKNTKKQQNSILFLKVIEKASLILFPLFMAFKANKCSNWFLFPIRVIELSSSFFTFLFSFYTCICINRNRFRLNLKCKKLLREFYNRILCGAETISKEYKPRCNERENVSELFFHSKVSIKSLSCVHFLSEIDFVCQTNLRFLDTSYVCAANMNLS